MDIKVEELIDIHGETYGISIKLPIVEAKCLSIGICSSEVESAVMDFLLLLHENKSCEP
jgi:hypothetical protein